VSFLDGVLPDWPQRTPFYMSLFELLPVAHAASVGAKVIVTTKTGMVEVRNERGSQRVFAGTQVTLAPGSPPGRQEPANLGQVLQWTRRKREEVALQMPREATVTPGTAAVPSDPQFRTLDTSVETATPVVSPSPEAASEVAPDFLPDATEQKPLRLFPPVIVEAIPEVGKVTLRWIDDGATTYPVVGYNVYRTTLDPESEPRRLNVSLVPVTRLDAGATGGTHVDTTIVGDARYAYHVRALASRDTGTPPPANQRAGLLESPASAGMEVRASRDFILTLTGWSEKPEKTAHILVQKWHNGRPLGHVFQARVGDSVGRILDVRLGGIGSKPDVETVDFSTGCTLIDLRQVRRVVPGGIVPGKVAHPLTLPSQTAILLGPDGKTIELPRHP
jgi:hypothetical protein